MAQEANGRSVTKLTERVQGIPEVRAWNPPLQVKSDGLNPVAGNLVGHQL